MLERQVSNRALMNKVHPKKLLNSKWTAVAPMNREKHFIVSEMEIDEDGLVVACRVEAVMSKRTISIDWHDLRDDDRWIQGWK